MIINGKYATIHVFLNFIQFLGRDMSLEEALGDDGISAIIAQAVLDPKVLAQMRKQPGMATPHFRHYMPLLQRVVDRHAGN